MGCFHEAPSALQVPGPSYQRAEPSLHIDLNGEEDLEDPAQILPLSHVRMLGYHLNGSTRQK